VHKANFGMLQVYRAIPHPATNRTPYELITNRDVKMKLEHFPSAMSPQDQEFNCNDQSQKEKNNQNNDQ